MNRPGEIPPTFIVDALRAAIDATEAHARSYAADNTCNPAVLDSVIAAIAIARAADFDRIAMIDSGLAPASTALSMCLDALHCVMCALGSWTLARVPDHGTDFDFFIEEEWRAWIADLISSLPQPAQQVGAAPPAPVGLASFHDIAATEVAAQPLVRGLLDRGTLGCLWGVPNAGKSTIGAALALSVTASTDFLGMPTSGGCVIYVAAERAEGLRRRVRAWAAMNPDADASDFFLVDRAVNLVDPEGVDVLLAYVDYIKRKRLRPVALVVFDTLAKCIEGSDENSGAAIGAAIANMARLQARGCTVLTVHHPGHDAQRPRGHSSFGAALDTSLQVVPARGGGEVRVRKQRDLPADGVYPFKIVAACNSVVVQNAPAEPFPSNGAQKMTRTPAPDLDNALTQAVTHAAAAGTPMWISGQRGLFHRRAELPSEFHALGRDRMERKAAELVRSGRLVKGQDGALKAPLH